jgi:hypothetical protein
MTVDNVCQPGDTTPELNDGDKTFCRVDIDRGYSRVD